MSYKFVKETAAHEFSVNLLYISSLNYRSISMQVIFEQRFKDSFRLIVSKCEEESGGETRKPMKHHSFVWEIWL